MGWRPQDTLLYTAVALVLLIGNELAMRRSAVERLWLDVGGWTATVTPTLIAWATLIAGSLLLFSGATPIAPARLGLLEHLIPLPLVEASHFLGSVAGAGLLILARGLQHRLDSAWMLALGLLLMGIVASLMKGFDYAVGNKEVNPCANSPLQAGVDLIGMATGLHLVGPQRPGRFVAIHPGRCRS